MPGAPWRRWAALPIAVALLAGAWGAVRARADSRVRVESWDETAVTTGEGAASPPSR